MNEATGRLPLGGKFMCGFAAIDQTMRARTCVETVFRQRYHPRIRRCGPSKTGTEDDEYDIVSAFEDFHATFFRC